MNRFFSHNLEKFLEFWVGVLQEGKMPDQFRPLDAGEFPQGLCDPQSFYALPAPPPEVVFTSQTSRRDGSRRATFEYPSPLVSPYASNNLVSGLANLRPEGSSRGALILLHGHKTVDLGPQEWFCGPSARAGFDIYYPALPYHIRRKPQGTFDGEYSISADIGRTLLAFQQAVLDTRALVAWIDARYHVPVYLAGISLGAYVAAMIATVESRLAGLVPILGGASFSKLVWEDYSLRYTRRDLLQGGITPAELEQDWALLDPGNWRPLLPPERIFLAAAEHDPAVRPENTRALWRAWGEPALRWYPCGHTSIFLYARPVGRDLARFLTQGQP